jgi:hypothetical protein
MENTLASEELVFIKNSEENNSVNEILGLFRRGLGRMSF